MLRVGTQSMTQRFIAVHVQTILVSFKCLNEFYTASSLPSLTNTMKMYQAVQKLLVGDTQTDGQTHTHTHTKPGDLISLLSFLESRIRKSKSA
jgi:hypothetical protein